MEKEHWKNEVMDSLRGIRRADPNPFLFTRIEAAVSRVSEVSPRQWRLAVAFGIALLLVNGWLVMRDGNASDSRSDSAYQLNNHRYQLY